MIDFYIKLHSCIVCVYVPRHICGDKITSCGSQFSSSALSGPRMKLSLHSQFLYLLSLLIFLRNEGSLNEDGRVD